MRGLTPLAIQPGSALLRVLTASLRNTLQDEAGLFDPARISPLILAIWHNRILCAPALFEFYGKRRRKLTILTSSSRDGSLLAGVTNAFGIKAVRGSSSKNGVQALRQLKTLVDNGHDIVIAPDGPRGPRYSIAPGILFLSRTLKIPIAPAAITLGAYRELPTWDRFRVPHPFTTCHLRIQKPRFFAEDPPPLADGTESLETLRSALDGNTMPNP
jgi:lysophospholipid acyltransferase (LPLAT)-like uncharacterized protein